MLDGIYQHFRREEYEIIDRFRSNISDVESDYTPFLTGFMNPREQFIAKNLVGKRSSVKIEMNGGYKEADRKRILFYPDYFEPDISDYEMQLLEIQYPTRFVSIHHRQILGAVMHSGLQRSVLGDIFTDGVRWQMIVDQKISCFLVSQINKIGSVKVKLTSQKFSNMVTPKNDWKQQNYLVNSERIDSLVSAGFGLSRNRAKELINNSKVQLNWMIIDRPDYQVRSNDVITVRGFGRLRFDEQTGITHKGKYKIKMSVLNV